MKRILGGLKGYSFGTSISTSYFPPTLVCLEKDEEWR